MTKNPTTEVTSKTLTKAVQDLHRCTAVRKEAVPVKEIFQGQTVWEGAVQVFNLSGHPSASRCYAWSHVVDDSGKRKFFAVLHQGPVDSPQAAVRAAIVAVYRKKASRNEAPR